MKNITYRLAENNEKDVQILYDLNVEFEKFNQGLSTRPEEHFEEGWETFFREEIVDSLKKNLNWTILAFDDSKPIGFIFSRVCEDCQEYLIDQLYINPEYRGHGVGQELLKQALEIGEKYDYQIMVEVFDWNEPAYKFYLKNGFSMDSHKLAYKRKS